MPVIDSELEDEPEGEAEAILRCLEAVAEAMEAQYPPGAKPVRRDAHPKHHGIVRATLVVDQDIPEELRHGIFEEPGARFKAWVRFSNGSPKPQADIIKDGRGMAIKVFGVEGERAVSDPALHNGIQDFVMIDHPAFFIQNPRQYAPFVRLQTRGKAGRFFFGWNPCRWHIRQGLIARRVEQKKASMLENRYFSMSPFKLGPHAIKFSVQSRGPNTAKIPSSPSHDFLHEEMKARLGASSVTMDFMIQKRTHPSQMPIENAAVYWSEKCSPFQRIASIEIDKQVFDSKEQMEFGENISFNPWNSLMDHAPLGGLNRLRLAVYKAVSKLRHERNSEPIPEPTGDETF